MTFTITKQDLMSALNLTKHISKPKKQKRFRLIQNDYTTITTYKSGYIRITAHNETTNSYISCKRMATGVKSHRVIKLRTTELCHIIKILPAGDLHFSEDGDNVVIKIGEISAVLTHNRMMVIRPYKLKKGKYFTELNTDTFKKMIDMTSFSISKDKTQPHIGGALLQKEGGFLRMVATDGHRLSKVEVKTKMRCDDFSVVIPRGGIAELKRLFAVKNSDIVVGLNKHKFFITTKNVKGGVENMLVVALGDSDTFPSMPASLLDAPILRRIGVNTKALLTAVKRCTSISPAGGRWYDGIRIISIEQDKLLVRLERMSQSLSSIEETISATYALSGDAIHINPKYLADALGVVAASGSVGVSIEVMGNFISVIDHKNNFMCIIMLMRD